MPNVALLLGAGLLGALVAGIYLLYSDEGFSNFRAHEEQTPPPGSSRRRSNAGYNGTSYSERFDTPVDVPGRRRKRSLLREPCVICCDSLDTFCSLQCGHKFHTKCIQRWINEQRSETEATCPTCRCVIKNSPRILSLAA